MDRIIPKLEFSRLLDVSDLPAQGLDINVEATPVECEALCRRFDLEALRGLAARIRVERATSKDGVPAIRARVAFSAQVEQICVVTLDPIALDVADEFDILFVLSSDCPDGEDASLAAMSEDSPEPLAAPEIDLGELVAQHLVLALDPYPRRRGAFAEFDGEEAQNSKLTAPADNPFAMLGQLKRKM